MPRTTAPPAGRRTTLQVSADEANERLARRLGSAIREVRLRDGLTQRQVAERAGVHQTEVSYAERGKGVGLRLRTWTRLAAALDRGLAAYLEQLPGAEQPRDHVHLRHQELISRIATDGGWSTRTEAMLDPGSRASRSGDVLLERTGETALVEIWDWFDDVGAAFRSWDGKLEKVRASAGPTGVVSGVWAVRATRRNRDLVVRHASVFGARFPGSSSGWLRCLGSRAPMPPAVGMLWISVAGDRLVAARPAAGRPSRPATPRGPP
jgi:transcriptional regulator with XRE-family HTH domain